MGKVTRSPAIEIDVDEIAKYIARDNRQAAFRWLDELDRVLNRLAIFPGLGQARDDLLPAMRSLPMGSYIVFYETAADGIAVVRVLHGARQLRPSLFRHGR